MAKVSSFSENDSSLLGEIFREPEKFPTIDSAFVFFKDKRFLDLSLRKRFRKINEMLCGLILKATPHSFLLSAVLDFIDRINREKIAKDPFNFSSFEFWLNNFSELSDDDNYIIRAKIAGKYVPRSDYQGSFPIGMDRVYNGSHFVVAHLSPDIDTMIASFWSWIDAFAARIGTGQHQWLLPNGPPDSPFTNIFRNMVSHHLFNYIPRTTRSLTLTSMDLVTQRNLVKKSGNTFTHALSSHDSRDKAIILVNDQGNYLGDWHSSDVELTRQVAIPFKSCLRWFENNLHTNLISLFAKRNLSIQDFPYFYFSIFEVKIKDCEPALEFNEKQKIYLNDFFKKIIGLEKGFEGNFNDLIQSLKHFSIEKMADFQSSLEKLFHSDLFDSEGRLKENRPEIFNKLERLIHQLDEAIQEARNYVERLDILLMVKHKVLKVPQTYLTLRSDVEEMRNKMENHDFLSVVINELNEELFPVGIVRSADLWKERLGTVSFRDFCNFEEVKMASHLEVISVIDHHKNTLKTNSVPSVLISDVQSCNVLLAEQAFLLNDKYSLGGMTELQIDEQIKSLIHAETCSEMRILQKLLQRRIAAKNKKKFYIHPNREYCEYFSFLQAILDDTDLLTKVSLRDLECIAQLLNRLKSLSLQQEAEVISFDHITRDSNFIDRAAHCLLQQEDMYSIYKHVYSLREKSVEDNLDLCLNNHESNIFIDAKEQNGCARVGQSKLFSQNFSFYLRHANEMRTIWLEKSKEVFKKHHDIDLHIHMISTIASAEEVYRNQIGPYEHQDELWIWIPPTQIAHTHLNSFLANFQHGIQKTISQLSLEFYEQESSEFVQIFTQHFPTSSKSFKVNPFQPETLAILRFNAGALNSRKSMITPFLPRLLV